MGRRGDRPSTDARNWPTDADARIGELVAGFIVGEAGVAEHLHAFFDGDAAATFEAQRRDEERHARFFARYAEAVGLTDPRAHVSAEFIDIFERRLPEAAAQAGIEAVGLYHMVLEGVVFTAGQYALLEILDPERLPGCTRGWSSCCATRSRHISASARAASTTPTSTRPRSKPSSPRARAPRSCAGARAGRARAPDPAPADGGGGR